MKVTITPKPLAGVITPPPSKSQSHRFIIAAALAEGESIIQNVARSQDIEATLRCMAELGADVRWEGETLVLKGVGADFRSAERKLALPQMDCGESGSTLRFLIPIAVAVRGGGVFTGQGRLMERPQKPYFDMFDEKGIFYERTDNALTVQGRLSSGIWALPGDVSSQFFTGLLYALPLMEGESYLKSTTSLQSSSYLDMTAVALAASGVEVEPMAGHGFLIKGGQRYAPIHARVETDWSQAGFWFAAMALGNLVDVTGLEQNSAQGDRVMGDHFRRLSWHEDVEIDVSDCPDLVPPLAAIATARVGQTTRLVNAARLRMKESDRLASVREELCKLGAQVEEGPDSLTIVGTERLRGGTVDAHNDHRIAMMLAITATRCVEPVTICGAESVRKSYPNFWEDYVRLGGELNWAE